MTRTSLKALAASAAFVAGTVAADACTRVVYLGPEDRIITARSMDWNVDIGTDLWVLPRGMERDSASGEPISWTSRYGSVIATAYDIATSDGMNEAGLVANLLWLAESEFPETDSDTPRMSVSVWAQYMLDNFATVAEAVEAARREEFAVATEQVPGQDRLATVHLSLSDATGDSAIFEYVGGELIIHHDRAYQVMTNSPTYDRQLALAEYWTEIGGTVMLPGTNRASDRFARASFYVNAIPQVEDRRTATASMFGVIRNASVPYGITTPDHPNISSTRWRTVSDHKDRIYYFESAVSPNAFWVELDNIDFSEDSGARVLRLGENQARAFSGEVSAQFEDSEPFTFMGVD
jgi:penicillin V acylase-like amidase (Ntn superfamily)